MIQKRYVCFILSGVLFALTLSSVLCYAEQAYSYSDIRIANQLSNDTGVPVDEILKLKDKYDSWQQASKALIESIPRTDLKVPQELFHELLRQGYTIEDVIYSYCYSISYKSSPYDILALKPKSLIWKDFGVKLSSYQIYRGILTRLTSQDKALKEMKVIVNGKETVVKTKDDIFFELNVDVSNVEKLRKLNITDEDILAVVISLDIENKSLVEYISSLETLDDKTKNENMLGLISKLNKAAGITK